MKFAQVGYGHDGRATGEDGIGYTYLVNDTVRKGDTIYPSVKHWKNGKIFSTTGMAVATAKRIETFKGEDSDYSEQIRDAVDSIGGEKEVAKVVSAKETGLSRAIHGKREGKDYIASQSEKIVRGANAISRSYATGNELSGGKATTEAVETFESYSKKFIGGKQ